VQKEKRGEGTSNPKKKAKTMKKYKGEWKAKQETKQTTQPSAAIKREKEPLNSHDLTLA